MPDLLPPPPSTSDSAFFAVFNPYPCQPQGTLADKKTFARWLACIVGAENLISFWYKPSSSNIVLVETTRDGFDQRLLLGQHKWGELLKDASMEEKTQATCVYQCTKNNTWDLDKARWMRTDFSTAWFNKWSPERDYRVVFPYPPSTFCKPPTENVTAVAICRPLLQAHFEARPPASAPVFTPANRDPATAEGDTEPLTTDTDSNGDPDSTVPRRSESLWAGYDTEDASVQETCEVHGALCSSGICALQAARKKEEALKQR
ncbi:uncharacterized protein BXZ73DRAFT_28673, partial [Epithele typhae]|uniref:uncharacterized protein n=1 Tax=Epithele typhae TaxID=378194 RepID=UPI00200736C0